MVAKACVCSQVLTTTASKELAWSNSLRKSVYFLAAGYLAPAASSALALTSQRATMFSEATDARLAAPRPPAPTMARFSLLLASRACRKAGAATVAPAAARKRRRVIRRVMAVFSSGAGIQVVAAGSQSAESGRSRRSSACGVFPPQAEDLRLRALILAGRGPRGYAKPRRGPAVAQPTGQGRVLPGCLLPGCQRMGRRH